MEWVTWALQGLLAFLLYQIWAKLDANTKAITAVKELLLEEYLKKTEFETYRKETRQAIHEMRNKMTDYEARLFAVKR